MPSRTKTYINFRSSPDRGLMDARNRHKTKSCTVIHLEVALNRDTCESFLAQGLIGWSCLSSCHPDSLEGLEQPAASSHDTAKHRLRQPHNAAKTNETERFI